MNKINKYKNILIGLTITIIIIIIIFTIDVIIETPNWSFFDIDFKNKNNIISAYGTLIGGILSFLSILFVLYGLLEQRQQILQEKKNEQHENKQKLLDKLKLLVSYFNSTVDDIIAQGDIFKEFYEKEKENPSKMNVMYFIVNNNFSRIIDMDPLTTYKAIRMNFSDKKKWEKLFLSIYSIFDFYSESIIDLRSKYKSQITFKVKVHRKIGYEIDNVVTLASRLGDKYRIDFPADYMNKKWVILVDNFIREYHKYLKKCDTNGIPSDFREISDNHLLPFIKQAMILRNTIGYEKSICLKLVEKSSSIRKKINEIEFNCINYAKDIEKQYEEYYSIDNKHLKELITIKEKIDIKVNL